MNKERELTSSLVKTVLKIMGKVQIYPDRKKLKEVIFINEPRNSPPEAGAFIDKSTEGIQWGRRVF